nr:hypothetical protein [uncultured Draconibacterium sp.]
MQKIFSIAFLAIAIIYGIGFLFDKGNHCLVAALLTLVLSIVLKPKQKTNGKAIQSNRG